MTEAPHNTSTDVPESPRQHTVEVIRSRLIDTITVPRLRRITLICAPAGYGKSTLLGQLAGFLGKSGYHCVQSAPTSATVLARDVSTLTASAASGPVCCFIDWNISTEDILSLLATTLPRVHFVIASRNAHRLQLSRLRLLGQIEDIRADDVAFDINETRDFLNQSGLSLTEAAVAMWQQRTEGWIAGLKLSVLIHRPATYSDGVHTQPSGEQRWVQDFFQEELLAGQPLQIQDFLTHFAIVRRGTAVMLNALREAEGSQSLLDHCDREGLFVFPMDGHRREYRLHVLAAEYLERRLHDRDPASLRMLHRRASEWHWKHQHVLDAFEHALRADEVEWAARIVDMSCSRPTNVAQGMLVMRLAERVPPDIRAQYPNVIHALTWPLIRSWQFERTRHLLFSSRARIEQLRQESCLSANELSRLEATQLHRSMLLARYHDDPLAAEARCLELLALKVDLDGLVKGSQHTSLIHVRTDQYNFTAIDYHAAQARDEYQRFGVPLFPDHQIVIGQFHFMTGHTAVAVADLKQALHFTTIEAPERSLEWGSTAALPLAAVLYELNQLTEAEQLIDLYLPHGDHIGSVGQLIAGYITKARLQVRRNELRSALETLDGASTIAQNRGFKRLGLQVCAQRVRILLQEGKRSEALDAAAAIGIRLANVPETPTRPLTTLDECRADIWVQLARDSKHAKKALALARAWLGFFVKAHALEAAVRWQIIVADLLAIDGQLLAAQRALRRATDCAASARYVGAFIDANHTIATLLRKQFASDATSGASDTLQFVQDLVTVLSGRTTRPLLESEDLTAVLVTAADHLDSREREVLALVGLGMRNADIGRRLGMTESSVKWYMRRVFDKIGVRKRSLAAQKARHFGLIH